MANEALVKGFLAIPTLERFKSITIQTTDVDTTAEAIPGTAMTNRKAILVQNKHATACLFFSSSAVTAHADNTVTGGYQLGPKDAVFMTLDGSATLYAISDSANTGVCTVEFS